MHRIDSITPLKTIEVPPELLDSANMTISKAIKLTDYAVILVKENKRLAELGGTLQALYEEKTLQVETTEKKVSSCDEMRVYHAEKEAECYKNLKKEERRKKFWKGTTVAVSGFALGYVLLDRLGLIR